MGYRDDALARLDLAAFLGAQGVVIGKTVGPNEVRFKCPFHDDAEASANFNPVKGLWHCHVCNVGGSAIDFLMRKGDDFKDALSAVGEFAGLGAPGRSYTNGGGTPRPTASAPRRRQSALTEDRVKEWYEAGQRADWLVRWFTDRRGYLPETVERWQIGWDGDRVTLPIRDADGVLVNVRRRRDPRTADDDPAGKVLGFAGNNEARLWPLQPGALPDDVVLVEGEWDAMKMLQEGFAETITVTSGAGIWKPEWTPLFEDRGVSIMYDNDTAGQKGSARVASILAPVARVRIVQIPNLPDKGDVTDFFVEQSRTAEELRGIIEDATPYVVAIGADEDTSEARRMPLNQASDARFRGQKLELPVLLSGKAMTPYTVPSEFTVRCDMSNRRFCAICPMQAVSGYREVKLQASDPAVLSLINVTSTSQYEAIKELAKAVKQCNRPQVEVKASTNIEELRLIPEIDIETDNDGDGEYVSRTGYFLGHGLMPNRSYRMIGYAHPSPKTQATVHLLQEAIPAQDNISAFAMTSELAERLKIFQAGPGDVAGRFIDIYDDFRSTVHRIQARLDMQIAFDLIWHSVVGFYFNGAYVRRGWVEGMLMSDSGQGKTEMATTLLHHYGLGERVQSEQSSTAGLIGGLEKMGDTWMLSWGRIPLNDKRLLIIDETQGLRPESIESMSDIRATGVAEITKIRTEKTNARCRIAWLANPVSGLTLAQHSQGVLAVKELFKKPEDVRRLDFAIAMSSNDVDFARSINVRHGEAGASRYMSDLCRSLVLWAWSRRADQIEFTGEATDAVLAAATAMGRKYHSSIPLVEPSDQRLKIARLATAAAARVFSTVDGEKLLVTAEHVDFVVEFLNRIYCSPAMAYDEYSEAMRRGEHVEDDEQQEIFDAIRQWTNSDDAIAYLRVASIFRKSDLADGLDWTDAYTREQLKFLQSHRLIRTTRTGYYRTPAFIDILRKLANHDDVVPATADSPF